VNDKNKEYARYAAHCLHMVTAAKNQDDRAIQREMAAEWIRLADTVLQPLHDAAAAELGAAKSFDERVS
jgi:hypothetical protein